MELRLGCRMTLVLVILALTLSGERVEAQRAGKTIKIEYSDMCNYESHYISWQDPPSVAGSGRDWLRLGIDLEYLGSG